MTARLRKHAAARVDQHDGQVGGGGACGHVARVLFVARRIGDDELPLGCGEIPVCDIDRDALFAFCAQSIGEQREVHDSSRLVHGGLGDGAELVLVHSLRVVEEAADERGFSIVDTATGNETEQVLFFFATQEEVDSGQCFGGLRHVRNTLRVSSSPSKLPGRSQ